MSGELVDVGLEKYLISTSEITSYFKAKIVLASNQGRVKIQFDAEVRIPNLYNLKIPLAVQVSLLQRIEDSHKVIERRVNFTVQDMTS